MHTARTGIVPAWHVENKNKASKNNSLLERYTDYICITVLNTPHAKIE